MTVKPGLLAIPLVLIAVALGWNAGELHKRNCQRAGNTSCSILPWDQGQRASVIVPCTDQEQARLLLTGRSC